MVYFYSIIGVNGCRRRLPCLRLSLVFIYEWFARNDSRLLLEYVYWIDCWRRTSHDCKVLESMTSGEGHVSAFFMSKFDEMVVKSQNQRRLAKNMCRRFSWTNPINQIKIEFFPYPAHISSMWGFVDSTILRLYSVIANESIFLGIAKQSVFRLSHVSVHPIQTFLLQCSQQHVLCFWRQYTVSQVINAMHCFAYHSTNLFCVV